MREILFRGFHPDENGDSKAFVNGEWINGFWVYGDLIQLHDGRMFIVNSKFGACIDEYGNFINTEYPFVCVVIPKTVGQYTGLKDKNGKKIFEVDIVKDAYNIINIIKFGFHNAYSQSHPYTYSGAYGFYLENYNESENFVSGFVSGFEIIGNIYENPELLEDSKE